jgi:hypothetical protein
MKKKDLKKLVTELNLKVDLQDAKIERIRKYIEKQLELSVDLSLEFDKDSVIDKIKLF